MGRIEDDGRFDQFPIPSRHLTETGSLRPLPKEPSQGDSVVPSSGTTPSWINALPLLELCTSQAMREVVESIRLYAESNATVLVIGETGTGKELVASAIHALRSIHGPGMHHTHLEAVNCGAIPEALAGSELFGHVIGAFSGASRTHRGHFERAGRGTLFLDEIPQLPLSIQAKLLRVLEGHGYYPVGAEGLKMPECSIIAATNRNLNELETEGLLLKDLRYRLEILVIEVAPLRERQEDILTLANHFLSTSGKNGSCPTLGEAAKTALLEHRWPGNVRELKAAIDRAVAIVRDREIGPEDLFRKWATKSVSSPKTQANLLQIALELLKPGYGLKELGDDIIRAGVTHYLGKGKTLAQISELMGMDQSNLFRRRRKLGLHMKTSKQP